MLKVHINVAGGGRDIACAVWCRSKHIQCLSRRWSSCFSVTSAWSYLDSVGIQRLTSGVIYQRSLHCRVPLTCQTTSLACGLNPGALKKKKVIQPTSVITASLAKPNCAAGRPSKLSTSLPGGHWWRVTFIKWEVSTTRCVENLDVAAVIKLNIFTIPILKECNRCSL